MNLGELFYTIRVKTGSFKKDIQEAQKQAVDSSKKINSQFEKLAGGIKKANEAINRFGDSAKKVGQSMSDVGQKMSMRMTLPIVAAGTAAFKMQKDFESAMSKIIGLVGVASDQVEQWSKDILKMAPRLGKAPSELADALFFVTSAGIKGAAAMDVLEKSAKASAAGLGETKIVADLVTSAMNAYGQANLSAGQATDILVAAVREGKAEAPELSAALGSVLPIASEMKVQFNEVGAAIAAMTRTGTNAATASMQLKNIMAAFLNPANEAENALAAMGTSSEEFRRILSEDGLIAALIKLKALQDEYGETTISQVVPNLRAMMGVFDLVGANMEDNIGIFERMTDTTGSLDHAFATTAKTADFKWKQALAAGQVALVQVGATVADFVVPILQKLAGWLNKVSEWWENLSESTKKTIIQVLAVTAAIGPLLVIGGKLVTVIGIASKAFASLTSLMVKMTAVMLTNPTGMWVMAIGAVALALGGLVVALRNTTKEQEAFNRANKKVNDGVGEQAAEISKLSRIIENGNMPLARRQEAIKELNKLVPEYNASLTEEGKLIGHNTKVLTQYLARLREKLTVMALEEEMSSILRAQQKEVIRLAELQEALAHAEEKSLAWKILNKKQLDALQGDIGRAEKAINGYETALDGVTGAYEDLNTAIKKNTTAQERNQKAWGLKVDTKPFSMLTGVVSDNVKALKLAGEAAEISGTTILQLQGKIAKLQEAFNTSVIGSKAYYDIKQALTEAQTAFAEATDFSTDAVESQTDAVKNQTDAAETQTGILNLLNAEIQKYNDLEAASTTAAQAVEMRKMADAARRALENHESLVAALSKQPDRMEPIGLPTGKPELATQGLTGEEEYEIAQYWIDRELAAETDANDEIIADEQRVQDAKNQMRQDSLTALSDALSAVWQFQEAAMQKELKMAGDNEAEKERIHRKYAKKRKAISIGEAIVGTAKAVINALQTQPFPLGLVMAGIAGAMGAAQIATIAGAPMKTGGIVPPGYPNDTYPALLTSGETVIPPKALPQMGGGQLTHRISGQDLLIILNEAQRRNTGNY